MGISSEDINVSPTPMRAHHRRMTDGTFDGGDTDGTDGGDTDGTDGGDTDGYRH